MVTTEKWSENELSAAVDAYVEMHHFEAQGKHFVKKNYYAKLSQQFGRTEKSYEYRMQNISYVYSLQGRQWLQGLKPAKNIGARVTEILERLIAKAEGQSLGSKATFEVKVNQHRVKQPLLPPQGSVRPKATDMYVTQYARDPTVVAWVLENAAGVCECCGSSAPFVRGDGNPYLEVHHVCRLADGGEDTIFNAVAVCPNCHRELHFGAKKIELIKKLCRKVDRLNRC